jgi:hypothetical protein
VPRPLRWQAANRPRTDRPHECGLAANTSVPIAGLRWPRLLISARLAIERQDIKYGRLQGWSRNGASRPARRARGSGSHAGPGDGG